MKKFYTSNQALAEILVENGVDLICNEDMEVTVSDEDAERIPSIVEEFAPAAIGDYSIE